MEKLGVKHQNLDRKIYQTLKAMILARKLAPGTKILQDKLAHELGVSRTPLINALKMLEHEKLIVSKPRRGFFVRLFSEQEMVHIFELREVLEGLTARRAASQATTAQIEHLQVLFDRLNAAAESGDRKRYAEEDRQFHNFLVEIGGKEFLSSILESYNIISFSYQYKQQEGLVRASQETVEEHRAIVEAIRHHDPEKAEKAMRTHLSKSIHTLKLQPQKEEVSKQEHGTTMFSQENAV
ncbi:hypothetical protein CSA56_16330 [candidate division KSB3 bacterium]|uniref:HTH gntR-type domain-containing protein n=1 Tax=candidate division KSB3 bacterium TaxID=2044937 RepID=A0A2G6K936_9BACT|nr:MAG: hypothetical protein CSA56_16330 [candidate division KSB3 bacterium]